MVVNYPVGVYEGRILSSIGKHVKTIQNFSSGLENHLQNRHNPPMDFRQRQLHNCITRPDDPRLESLKIPVSISGNDPLLHRYPMKITEHVLALMKTDTAVRRQFLPHADENLVLTGQSPDPLDENRYSPVPGLIHKYAGRVLLKVTHRCAAHCRFCFRKRFHNGSETPDHEDFPIGAWLSYTASRRNIREVILSGGDPLMLHNDQIRRILTVFAKIPHVDIIRIHSRILTTWPSRITTTLVRILQKSAPLWFVTHFNTAGELTPKADEGLEKLAMAGIPVLNQGVFLSGVNDEYEGFKTLCTELVRRRVRPYYMHLLDPAPGTAHFNVPAERAVELIRCFRRDVQGYAIPALVREIPGRPSKTPVVSSESQENHLHPK